MHNDDTELEQQSLGGQDDAAVETPQSTEEAVIEPSPSDADRHLDNEAAEVLADDDDEDEEDTILNAALLELQSEPSAEDEEKPSSESDVASEESSENRAEESPLPEPKRKKKTRESVPAAPLREETVAALEALLFASGDAMTLGEIKRVFARYWKRMEARALEAELGSLREALKVLTQRWNDDASPDTTRGFRLVHVAEGYAFRSSPEFSDVVRAMREQRPMRLSKPAMEVLSIVAYRQPVTKGEVDFIRGVDCGGTLRILLDRGMIKVVGKREEPGRPLLYGTTREFLNFFNLPTLRALPSLREYRELNSDSSDKLKEFDLEHGIQEIAEEAAQLQLDEEPAVAELTDAMDGLERTEEQARNSLAEHGIALDDEES